MVLFENRIQNVCQTVACIQQLFLQKRGEIIYELI